MHAEFGLGDFRSDCLERVRGIRCCISAFQGLFVIQTSMQMHSLEAPVQAGTNIYIYSILYSETQCISKLDKIGIFIDMKFH